MSDRAQPREGAGNVANATMPAGGKGSCQGHEAGGIVVDLYVVRHGPAEECALTGADYDRELTERGRQRVANVAAELRLHGEIPDRILSSPLPRAWQTAEIVARIMAGEGGCPLQPERCDDLAISGDAWRVVSTLDPRRGTRVMLVGHEPSVSLLARRLLPETFDISMHFRKAMVLGVRLDGVSPSGVRSSSGGLSVSGRFVFDPKRLVWFALESPPRAP